MVVALAEEHDEGDWIIVAGDDTVTGAKGKKVYGKGRDHDAVRSAPVLPCGDGDTAGLCRR